jgi:hypothetical protein
MKFIIKNSEDGQFYFKIESKNGQVLLQVKHTLKNHLHEELLECLTVNSRPRFRLLILPMIF